MPGVYVRPLRNRVRMASTRRDRRQDSPGHAHCALVHGLPQEPNLILDLVGCRGSVVRPTRKQSQVALRHQHGDIRRRAVPLQALQILSHRLPFKHAHALVGGSALLICRVAVPARNLIPNGLELARIADWRVGYAILADDLGLDRASEVNNNGPTGSGGAACSLDLQCTPGKSLVRGPDE